MGEPVPDARRPKAELRETLLEARRAIPPAEREALSAAICGRAARLPAFRAAKTVHAYFGVGSEVRTLPLLEDAWRAGKRLVCPRIGTGGRLESRQVRSPEDLVAGPRGLREPDPETTALVPAAEIDLVVVPGVGFDRRGGRLGFGGGYYDRFLSTTGALRLGLAFSLQIVDRIPQGPGDEPLHWIVTERDTIECRGRGPTPPGAAST
ncbi:MAG: 5-formyltetrahydrofolate cyclo-ligase [Gemmatimonadota bacterium]